MKTQTTSLASTTNVTSQRMIVTVVCALATGLWAELLLVVAGG